MSDHLSSWKNALTAPFCSCRRNIVSDKAGLADGGRAFQARAAAVWNEWSPSVNRWLAGKTSVGMLTDRRRRHVCPRQSSCAGSLRGMPMRCREDSGVGQDTRAGECVHSLRNSRPVVLKENWCRVFEPSRRYKPSDSTEDRLQQTQQCSRHASKNRIAVVHLTVHECTKQCR
jgi:hypothetical protein